MEGPTNEDFRYEAEGFNTTRWFRTWTAEKRRKGVYRKPCLWCGEKTSDGARHTKCEEIRKRLSK